MHDLNNEKPQKIQSNMSSCAIFISLHYCIAHEQIIKNENVDVASCIWRWFFEQHKKPQNVTLNLLQIVLSHDFFQKYSLNVSFDFFIG